MDSIGAGIKPDGEGFTGIEELKKPNHNIPQGKKLKGPTKSGKPYSNSNQAIKPGKSIKKLD